MGYEQKPPPQRSSAGPAIAAVAAAIIALVLAAGAVVVGLGWFATRTDETRMDDAKATAQTPAEAAPSDEVGQRLEARLRAAQLVSNPAQREEAYSRIAQDAASQGHGPTALRVLNLIGDPVQREATAFEVVRALSQSKQEEQALQAAQLIHDPVKRDKALQALATGEWPPAP
jgi:hypothetical protein